MKAKLKFAAFAIAGAAYAFRRWSRDKPGPDDGSRISYPPLDTTKPVTESVWIVDSGPIHPAGLSVPIRMTVIRLSNGDLLLHSPTQISDLLVSELAQLGEVRHLVAPTIAHWTFLPDWQKAFPQAEVWAVPGLRDRPQVRSSELRIDHDLGEKAPEPWAPDLEQALVEGGGGFREAYLYHRPSRTLVLADLIQNLEPGKLPPVTGLAAELALATRGKTAGHVRAATALGGEQAKEQIRQMVSLRPERVIFAHGSWFETDAARRLEDAFDWLL